MASTASVIVAVALIALANAQPIARCGPCNGNLACPWNDDGLGRINFCTKFGFCGPTASYQAQQDAGVYICSRSLDGSVDPADVCSNKPNPDAFCSQSVLNGSTCSLNDGRCQIADVKATTFIGYHAGTNAPAGAGGNNNGVINTNPNGGGAATPAPAATTAAPIITPAQSTSDALSMIPGIMAYAVAFFIAYAAVL
uniref:Uncharacterized protein n=1 Tax=Spongospora subterranea TaxID=70186 RepID=A0A0H5QZ38_9EUKA|eukprot:CRZ00809.1 hypothetical protein [Spongospora subterranea]